MNSRTIAVFFLTLNAIWISVSAQPCDQIILDEDFSSDQGWTTIGNGDVHIGDGYCNFDNVSNGSFNKVLAPLNATLSDDYWKVECEFTILSPNPPGRGTGEVLLALTAGDLDFISYDASQGYLETTQDGIGVLIFSPEISDNDVDNWIFLIESKKGNLRTFSIPSGIHADSDIDEYYIRLERLDKNAVRLSVFSNVAFTQHLPGSPVVVDINASITGLNTIQHGTSTPGTSTRFINARLDNVLLCEEGNEEKCQTIVHNEDFSSSVGWTSIGTGEVHISNGFCNYDNVYNGSYNKILRPLSATLSDDYWKAECDFTILSQNSPGQGTGEILLALTAGQLDFISYDQTQAYQETSQDGIGVLLFSPSISDNDRDNWIFLIEAKKGNVRTFDLNKGIYADSDINDYFIRLERLSKNSLRLSVFSDNAFDNHLPGSPVVFEIDATITGLNTIQHGTSTSGTSTRFINARLDNVVICDDGIEKNNSQCATSEEEFFVYPNPSTTEIYIARETNSVAPNAEYQIYDLIGAFVKEGKLLLNHPIGISELPAAMYFLVLHDYCTYPTKFVKFD